MRRTLATFALGAATLLLMLGPVDAQPRATRAPVAEPAEPPEAPQAEAAAPAMAEGAWMGAWLDDAIDGGVEIIAVVPGGPAALARLRPGDIILRANRKEIPVQATLRSVMARLSPGDPLEVQVLRYGRELSASVQLTARGAQAPWAPSAPSIRPAPLPRSDTPRAVEAPAPPPAIWGVRARGGELDRIGLHVADVTPALRAFYGAPEDAGVLVTRAEATKAAAEAGIRVGDILVRFGERKVATQDHAEASLERWTRNQRQPLAAVVVRNREFHTILLAARDESGVEVVDPSSRRVQERKLLSARLHEELKRLERRIAEIRREIEELRDEP